MSRVLAYIIRFAVIVLGLSCAWVAASAFVHLLVLGDAALAVGDANDLATGRELLTIMFGAFIIGRLSLWPALAVALAFEFFGRRDWLSFALAGAAVAVAALVLSGVHRSGLDQPRVAATVVASGLVGGIVYWAIAGRSSGRWLNRLTAPEQ